MNALKNGSKYSFSTIAPTILGNKFSNMLLEGTVSYRIAAKTYPVDSVAASVVPYLPAGVSTDQTTYTFYVFKSENNGSEVVLASEWINQASIQESLETYMDFRIHGVSQKDISTIKNILGLAGFNTVSVLTT